MQTALQKAKLDASQIGILFAGDLLDQCMASAMSAKDFNIPMAGLYGACSTFALGLALAAVFTDCNAVKMRSPSHLPIFVLLKNNFGFL